MSDPPLWSTAAAAALLLILGACVPASAAPMHDPQQVQHQLDEYYGGSTASGCYYNFVHYEEGDRIMTNEPCLNCTCHNRMLMCYLRVCPFSKGIGQDCTVEQKPDQCCPVITCPEVPVQLITSSTTITTPPAPTGSTAVGHPDNYGCTIDEVFYSDGTKIPGDPTKPCELCYCIRNHTACVMQECTLHVEGCRPVYAEGVCCPVRYDCDYQEYTTSAPLLETTVRPTPGLLFTTTMAGPLDCRYGEETYADGALIETEEPCQHCYCMRGDIVCAVQECGTPLEREAGNCTALPPQPGQCCPQQYQCDNVTVPFDIMSQEMETTQTSKSTASIVTGSTKSDEQLSLSTEATVVQQSNVDKEEDAEQQENVDETQEHLNEVEPGLEQHTHYDDEETEKGTEIEHVTNPTEHEGQGMIEQFTQSVEHLPEHPAEDSGHITLESESSVTEAVIASSEKQRTTLEGAETVTESLTGVNVAEGIQTVEQVTQQEFTPSSIENGNQDVHDEQSLTAEADNQPSAVQTTLSGESASPSSTDELPNVQETAEQTVPEHVTLKDEIDFTQGSTSATQKPSDTDEESVPVTHEIITGESDSTEKVEQQDLMSSSPQSSPTNEFITPAVEIQPSTDKTEESVSSENIPDAVQPLEGEEAESHVTDTQVHEDEHTVAAPVRTSIIAEIDRVTMPVQAVEHEVVTEGLGQTTFESANKVTVTESTEEHVTSGLVLESSSAADKFDDVPHEQSVTEANIAEEAGHTSNEAASEVHEAEQQTSDKQPQQPLDELATISQEVEPSTLAGAIHHTTIKSDSTGSVLELTTSASSDKQEESSSQAIETVINGDNSNELDSTTKTDETEQVTLFNDIPSSSESGINAEKRPEEMDSVEDLPPDTDTSLNEVLTTAEPSVAVTSINQESSINLLPGEEVGKPSESSEATSGETADESEASAEVADNIDTVTTKFETTEENIKEQSVTVPTELKPSASTGKTDEGLLITHPPETAETSASNEVPVESSGDSTEESVHHLVSEMNGKPTEIHTTPSESALSSQSSHEVTNGIPEESQQGGLVATEPAPPKEPVIVDQSTESGELFEQESSQKPALGEDAETVTSGSVSSEVHGTESTPQETKAPHETETSSEVNQKPESPEEIATEQASVSGGLQQEAVEQQVISEVTENVIVEQSSGGSSVISTPGFDEIEHEVSQQQTQKSTEAGGNQYTTEIPASENSGISAEQQPQKPAEDGVLPSVEGGAVTLETVTPPHDAPVHHETQEAVESEKQPSEFPLTTSGIGGFVQDLSTTTSMPGPVGIPTSVPPHALIPGEGSCLVDGKTYANNSEIPPPNHCHVSCHCMSSIVHCVSVNCPPPPTHLKNCTPVRHSDDACCPTYTCDVEHKVTLVADSMVAATGQPTVSSETSAAPPEDHKEDVKPQITDGGSSLNVDQDSNVVTEAQPVHHDTEEQQNAGGSAQDTMVTEKPETVSSHQDEQMPASLENTETQESHIPSSEKPADEHVMEQEEKDQQGTEVQQTVQPVEEDVAEEQAPSEVKPEGTEAVIQEGAVTLAQTVSPSESSVTLNDKNEEQVTTDKVSAEHGHVPTIAPAGISEIKEDQTYSPTSSAEDATTVLTEHVPGSSDEILSSGSSSTAADDEGPQQPAVAATEHTDIAPGLPSSDTDEQHVENLPVSTDHVTAAVEESAHEDQSSQTTVSSTDQTPVSRPQMEITDAESVPNGQNPSENIPDEKLPPAETVTEDHQIVSIIHADVPTVAPPESDSQSKYPTTVSSEQEKPQEFLNTGKPEVSSSRPESYETITTSFSDDDKQQAATTVIHHLPSEKPTDHQQETEFQTVIPPVTGFEEAVSPQHVGDVISEEGSGHEEPILSTITEAVELEQQSPSHPEDMEEHQQTVSQGSLLPGEETTVQTESQTQQSSVSIEHLPPIQPVGEEHGGVEEATAQPETNNPEQDTIVTGESGDMQTISPVESDSQQSSVAESHPFDSDLTTIRENEQSSPSMEAITEPLPQQPVINEAEAESNEQTVTLPSSNKEDSTVIQESLVTEQEKQTVKLPEEVQTVSPIDGNSQQESSSQQPVEQLSDTEETAEQQTVATVAASQQPDTVMQEEVTDKISDDTQTSVPIETDSQHVVGSYPHDFHEGSGAMETQEVQTLSPVVVEEEESSTISQVSALPGSEAASDAETGQEEKLPAEEEKETVTSQQPIEVVSQQQSVSEEVTADSVTESFVEQQTSLPLEVSSQQDIISQEPVVDEEHEQTTFATENQFEQTLSPLQPGTADKEPNLVENEVTTASASDSQTFVSGEPISSEEERPDNQQTLLPSEEDYQHVSVPQQNAPITEEMPFQTASPVYEDKESSTTIVTVSEDKTPGISEETNKPTAHPIEHDDHPVTSHEGAPVTEPAEQQTRFTAEDGLVHTENTQKPSQDSQQVTEILGLSDTVTNIPVEANSEQFLTGEGGMEQVTGSMEGQTISPIDSENKHTDIPSHPVISGEEAQTVSSSGEEQGSPAFIHDVEQTHPESQGGHEMIVTEILHEQSTSGPEQPEISATTTMPVAGMDGDIQITNTPEEQVSPAAETNDNEAGEINADTQTVISQEAQSPVDTVSTVQELGEIHPSTPEEIYVQQVTTAPIPETSSDKTAEVEGSETQQSSVPSETGNQETSTLGEQEASVVEDTEPQQTISPIESGAQTVDVSQPVSAPDTEQEPASPSEPEIQQAPNTEQAILAEGDSSSVGETITETATSAAHHPAPSKEEQPTPAESPEQTARPIESDDQEAIVTEGITSDKDTSISTSKPAAQDSVSQSTITPDEHHEVETIVSTHVPEDLESHSSSTNAPDVLHGEHDVTSASTQPTVMQESSTVTLGIIHPSQTPIESADHHMEISEQSSHGTVTEETVVQHSESHITEHTTSASSKPVVPEEEQVANNVHPVEVTEGNQILTASSEYPVHTTAQPALASSDHTETNQVSAVQENELDVNASSSVHADQKPAHSSTSHPAYEHFPEDHTLGAGEGIEHITEATKRPTHHFTTRPPFTTGSHHHPSQHPEDQYEQFPFGEGQYPTGVDSDYDDEEQAAFGPGTCRYGGKVYVSAQQIPRDDPCDFCFCFRSDIICLQQSCPPPIPGCHEEPIQGFCCPRYECPVSMATVLNVSTTTTTTTTTLPPHFLAHHYKGAAHRTGCQVQGSAYRVGEVVHSASGPCLECRCGGDGQMKCDPKECSPEPMLRKMIMAAAASRRR